jgi:DNA modification methylase
VMAGDTAALLSTDPPYCVNYTGMDRPIHDGKPSGKDWSHVYREVDIKDLGKFLDGVFTAVLPHVRDDAGVYVWHAHTQQPTIAATFEKHGLLLHQIVCWVKPCATFGHSYYRWKHEPCAFGWKKGNKPAHGFGQLDSVWEIDWDGKARVVGNEHPTEKPTRLFEIPMEVHTKPGAIVIEPFSGSGSQIIAAEKLRRRCRAVEIQPAFVDVAIRRWQKATGRDATLDGRTYAAVAAERGKPIGGS